MSFTVAVVGRPNVGKSTLFNRLVGQRIALVDDTPGVTRDRREGQASLGDLHFTIIDTAGYENVDDESLQARMQKQTELAVVEADVCLFVVDGRAGLTPLDEYFADILRKSGGEVLLVANKCEGRAAEAGIYESYKLGLGDPIAISAEHGEGMGDLYAALERYAQESELAMDDEDLDDPDRPLRLAIVGRPNVGKSTLINQIIGEDRLLTGPEAGITRDAISVDWSWGGKPVLLFDTAGIRRRARVTKKLEKLSVGDTLRAVRFAEVVVLLMDATNAFEKQDLQIADLVVREGRALILALNKWDLVDDKVEAQHVYQEKLERLLPQIRGVPLLKLSALRDKELQTIMPAVEHVYRDWNAKVKTSELNAWLKEMEQRHPPPAVGGKRIRLRYLSQTKSRPPTFVLFASRANHLPDSYKRYLVNGLRQAFDIEAVPIRLQLKQGKNPYTD